jgi:hypothetical protein
MMVKGACERGGCLLMAAGKWRSSEEGDQEIILAPENIPVVTYFL